MITCLQDLLDSEDYKVFESDTLLNVQYHIINNTWIDVDVMITANQNGEFGVSHSDFIDCWIDYMETIDLDDDIYASIMKEIIKTQEWHTENKSIDTLI